ncbi:MAG: hypothetical protein ABJ091_12335 [Lentilitoribacter sp.]
MVPNDMGRQLVEDHFKPKVVVADEYIPTRSSRFRPYWQVFPQTALADQQDLRFVTTCNSDTRHFPGTVLKYS